MTEGWKIVQDKGTFTDYGFHDRAVGERVIFMVEDDAEAWVAAHVDQFDPLELFIMPAWVVDRALKEGFENAMV